MPIQPGPPTPPNPGPHHPGPDPDHTAQPDHADRADNEPPQREPSSWTWPVSISVLALVAMSFGFVCALIGLHVPPGQASAITIAVVAGIIACVLPRRRDQ
ncbi:hypothetical protein ACFXHA_02565 [Nocardia sp. NPDC059240]|uniref:hypothetical protein n=1 Tax=Nocardia sp. NPDC059240 TaxID=3346786 RepID=UPI0036CACE90